MKVKTGETATGRRETIFAFMKTRNYVTADAVSEALSMSRRSACRHLASMLEDGYIEIVFTVPTWTSKHPVNHYAIVNTYKHSR